MDTLKMGGRGEWAVPCRCLRGGGMGAGMAGEGFAEEVRSELGPKSGFNWVKWRGSGKIIPAQAQY